MPFRAKLNGREIVSITCSEAEWGDAVEASSKRRSENLFLICCPGTPAVAAHSPKGLRYFSHKPGFERCGSDGESPEHLELKNAALKAVRANPNWSAEAEVDGDGWRADVLAKRGDVALAIEIQLSAQAKRETEVRNDKFEASSVSPFWLKGGGNATNDFGIGLQASISGKDIEKKSNSVGLAINKFLDAVERQVRICNNVTRILKRELPNWGYKIEKQGTIPACIRVTNPNSKEQEILLAELGPAILPITYAGDQGEQIGRKQIAGALVILRAEATHVRGYGVASIKLSDPNDERELARRLLPILTGKKVWRGDKHEDRIPGSFVHYPEECEHCSKSFLRVTHLVFGVPFRFDGIKPVATSAWNKFKLRLPQLERLAGLLDLPLGPISETRWIDASWGEDRSGSQIVQHCPHCGKEAPKALLPESAVLTYWPGDPPDFFVRMKNRGKGWVDACRPIYRKTASLQLWDQLVTDAKNARREEAIARERKAEEARRALLAQMEAMKRERERHQRELEAQKIREQQQREKEAADAAQAAKERAAAPKLKLLREAAARREPNEAIWKDTISQPNENCPVRLDDPFGRRMSLEEFVLEYPDRTTEALQWLIEAKPALGF